MTALGFVFFIDGEAHALFPGGIRRFLEAVRTTPDDRLRIGGLAAAAAGLILVWLARVLILTGPCAETNREIALAL